MYYMRIEHDGYDQRPHSFEYPYDVADFIRLMLRSGDIGDKVTVTMWEKKDERTMAEILTELNELEERSEKLLEGIHD